MLPSIPDRSIYAFFRLGLVTGLVPKSAVTRWADRQLLDSRLPTEEIIELSLSDRLPISQLLHLLHVYQGAPHHDLPMRLLLARAGQLLAGKAISPERLVQELSLLNAEEYLPPQWRAEIQRLGLALKRQRLGETAQDHLLQTLVDILQPYHFYRAALDAILWID